MILWRLKPEGKRLLTPELASGRLPRWTEADYAALLDPHPRAVELHSFDLCLNRALERCRPYDSDLDGVLAPDLHMSLSLTRREAADAALWRFLSVVYRPDFVRHRWKNRSWSAMRSRFWASGTRPDSNAIARLWWVAELTREGTDYTLTQRVLMRQPLVNNLFTRHISSYRPAVEAAVEVLGAAPGHEIEATLKLLTKALSMVVLESLDTGALVGLLGGLLEQARRQTP